MRIPTARMLTALAGLVVVAGIGVAPSAASGPEPAAVAVRPNVVFILVDDMSANLLPYMDATLALQAESVDFTNYITSNSLCCPSRASILTGKYPDNSNVLTNSWESNGGMGAFIVEGNEATSLGPYLGGAPYRSAFMGKYLNGYRADGNDEDCQEPDGPPCFGSNYVPPGWTDWFVPGDGYKQFDWSAVSKEPGTEAFTDYGTNDDADYLTDVLKGEAVEFIGDRSLDQSSYFLMVSTFAVHESSNKDPQEKVDDLFDVVFPPAPRDRAEPPREWPEEWEDVRPTGNGDCGGTVDCDDVKITEDAVEFANISKNPVRWMVQPCASGNLELCAKDVEASVRDRKGKLRRYHVERIQAAQAVDDLVQDVVQAVDSSLQAGSTSIVFATDNGFHLGDHGLLYAKSAAFDTDVRLPFFIRPPGGGSHTVSEIVQNVDLLPTILELTGAPEPQDADSIDGRSLAGFLADGAVDEWRNAGYIEYFTNAGDDRDPDRLTDLKATKPPTYRALRTGEFLYVDYTNPDLPGGPPPEDEAELYRLDQLQVPYQGINVFFKLTDDTKVALNDALDRYSACMGRTEADPESCAVAEQVDIELVFEESIAPSR